MQTQSHTQDVPSLDDIKTIKQMVAEHPNLLTEPMLRWQLRFRDSNGLAPAVITMGKSICLIKPRYEAWLANGAGKKVA